MELNDNSTSNSNSGKDTFATLPAQSDAAETRRKPRPSKARGLRTSTGWYVTSGPLTFDKLILSCSLTCRRRRVKCDELRPKCSQCLKSVCNFPNYFLYELSNGTSAVLITHSLIEDFVSTRTKQK